MIGVGINENVVLTGAVINEKGSLTLSFDELQNLDKGATDIFEASQTASVENDGKTGFNLNIFPFKVPNGPKNENKTKEELLEMISDDVLKVKNQLTQILELYLVSDAIKWDPYRGTGITRDNYREQLLLDEKLPLVFENYAKDFISMASSFFGKKEYAMRLKLIRQSKEKHFATLPSRFLKDNPFVELMDVPKEQTKVKFTKWEKDNGYDNGTPVPKAAADAIAPTEQTAEVQNVFGERH